LICATETKSSLDFDDYAENLKYALEKFSNASVSSPTEKKTLVD
jgi:hypothetical protein